MSCKLHEVTDDRADPAPGIITLLQRFLTDYTQDVIGDHSQFKHQLVAVKFPGWQPFNIHVRLDLAMVLLALSMSMIQIDDFLIRQGKVRPVCAKPNVRNKKELPVLVNGAFDDLINRTDTDCLFRFVRQGVCHISECLPNIDRLSVPWSLNVRAAVPYGFQPFLPAFLPRVALDNEGDIVVSAAPLHKDAYVFRRIIAGDKPDEQRLVCKLPAEGDGFTKKIRCLFLAVLLSNAKFRVDEITFGPYIGHDRCKAVESFVCAGDTFLFRLRIVKWRNIDIHRHISVFKRGGFDLHFAQQIYICLQDVPVE